MDAGICEVVSSYEWSSDIFYRKGIKGFVSVNTDIVLNMMDENRIKATNLYKEFMS